MVPASVRSKPEPSSRRTRSAIGDLPGLMTVCRQLVVPAEPPGASQVEDEVQPADVEVDELAVTRGPVDRAAVSAAAAAGRRSSAPRSRRRWPTRRHGRPRARGGIRRARRPRAARAPSHRLIDSGHRHRIRRRRNECEGEHRHGSHAGSQPRRVCEWATDAAAAGVRRRGTKPYDRAVDPNTARQVLRISPDTPLTPALIESAYAEESWTRHPSRYPEGPGRAQAEEWATTLGTARAVLLHEVASRHSAAAASVPGPRHPSHPRRPPHSPDAASRRARSSASSPAPSRSSRSSGSRSGAACGW